MRIALLDDYQQQALNLADWKSLPKGTVVQAFSEAMQDKEEVIRRLHDFDVVVAMRERTAFPASVIERLPNLKLLASTGLRNAAIDTEACRRQGITVCGARGARTGLAATAETAWALILALHKRLVLSHIALCEGRWQPQMALAMEGRVLGIAGLGNIGQRMARMGQAFGMDVIAWSPNLTAQRAGQAGVRLVGKEELFALSDVVSLHLVLSPATAGVVARPELSVMRPNAFLVNTARAGLVDEAALIEALQQRRMGGAGLDVFWQEPLPRSHALCSLDNVVMTPHLGYVTEDNFAAFYGNVLDNIKAWMDGRELVLLS
ncbi:D-2-hydroxyacid dehydrogenase family protein [Polaromonas sp.]|uniref:D-2-hydroxyacid dehydrogenase family protein n=1 Tax=Polaromonas sp. TaxID=1869339 RepID=UPI003BA902F4